VALHPERTIRWIPKASPVAVTGDASRIEQVVVNYLSNALKFSREDRAIEVCLSTVDGMAQVSVHDDGVGVPLAEQPHIWEQFYQAEGVAVQSSSQIGVGMGLYLSKAIIKGHHGQVGIESAVGQDGPQDGPVVRWPGGVLELPKVLCRSVKPASDPGGFRRAVETRHQPLASASEYLTRS